LNGGCRREQGALKKQIKKQKINLEQVKEALKKTDMAVINIKELEQIFSKVLTRLKFEGEEEFTLEDDFYKLIPTEKWTSFGETDTVHLGSLSDDISSLKKLVYDDGLCTFVDFDRLASVLRGISQDRNSV
jgi:hypothetical protein